MFENLESCEMIGFRLAVFESTARLCGRGVTHAETSPALLVNGTRRVQSSLPLHLHGFLCLPSFGQTPRTPR
jgi:hypothetical protein